MKSSTRYSLIAAGIVAFIILTPFIYLFVRGIKYDTQSRRFIHTGSLSVKTEPKGAKIYINGEQHGKTNKSIRFITPGDYVIELKKDGYFTWSKRLNIREQYVTWVNNNTENIPLFFSEPKIENLAENVTNVYAGKNKLLYTTKEKIYLGNLDTPTDLQQLELPSAQFGLYISATDDENYYLLNNADFYGIFDVRSNTITDITELVNKKAAFTSSSDFQESENILLFSDDNGLYQLQGGSVYKINWRSKEKTLLLDNVLAFAPNSGGIYYIKLTSTTEGIERNLLYARFPNLEEITLADTLPIMQTARLYLSGRNQLFVLGNSTLYAVNEGLNKIADYVSTVSIDNDKQKLIYGTGNEIGVYDLNNTSNTLITRSYQAIQNPIVNNSLGWLFFQNDGRLQNIELDNRDHQNNYTFANLSDQGKFFLDQQAEHIFVLDQGRLQRLTIR